MTIRYGEVMFAEGERTFSMSDFETRPSRATSRFFASRPRTAFMFVTLWSWVKPPF